MEKVINAQTGLEITATDLCNNSIGLGGEDEDRNLHLENAQHFDTVQAFLDVFDSTSTPDFIEWNLIVFQRVAQHKNFETGEEEPDCYAELLMLQQRRADLIPIYINLVTDSDASALYKYLEKSWIQNVQYWINID